MKKNIDIITYLFLGCLVVGFLSLLFYLTQENYVMLKQSNYAVLKANNIIKRHQRLSGDFKSALIYVTTVNSSTPKEYRDTYGTGIWQISFDLDSLVKLLDKNDVERKALTNISKQIDEQVTWLLNNQAAGPEFSQQRSQHISSLLNIEEFFDNKISELERNSTAKVNDAQSSLIRLHNWIITIIITSSLIIFTTLLLIYMQYSKVKQQNTSLREIAWIQSHQVRAQVATLLGLGQLLKLDNTDAVDNAKILNGIMETTHKLDEIVKEINKKTGV